MASQNKKVKETSHELRVPLHEPERSYFCVR